MPRGWRRSSSLCTAAIAALRYWEEQPLEVLLGLLVGLNKFYGEVVYTSISPQNNRIHISNS